VGASLVVTTLVALGAIASAGPRRVASGTIPLANAQSTSLPAISADGLTADMAATPDGLPRSADRDVQVMVELSDTPSVATYAVAYDRARLEAASLEANHNRPPALTAANDPRRFA